MGLVAVHAFAPATVANVASGFDVLGFALEHPGDTVEVERRNGKGVRIVSITGDSGKLPRATDRNTASVAVLEFLDAIGNPFGADISVHKGMPLKSGLGSSAASSVAAVYAANVLAGAPFDRKDLLPFALKAEAAACGAAHADNAAASLIGGFVLVRSCDPLEVIQLPSPQGLSCTIVHPHLEIDTAEARDILNSEIRLTDAVRQWGNLAALIAALYEGDLGLLGRSLQDVIIEPMRSVLIPGFARAKQAALQAGALGCSISGSGPSLFALCRSMPDAASTGTAIASVFESIGLACDAYLSSVNTEGAQVVRVVEE